MPINTPLGPDAALPFGEPVRTRAALAAGISPGKLRSRQLRAPFVGMRIAAGAPDDLLTRCQCLRAVLPPDAAFTGLTAAALHGWPLPRHPSSALEVSVTPGTARVRRPGVTCHQAELPTSELARRHKLVLTNGVRTLADLASSCSLVDLIVMADAALRRGDCTTDDLHAFGAAGRGRRCIREFRRMTDLADGRSESPMETLLRLIIVLSGLPAPTPQAVLYDSDGGWLARVDLLAPDGISVFEFDGADHDDPKRHASDVTRWRVLRHHGYVVYPFTARELFFRPHEIVNEYLRALGLPASAGNIEGWLREFRRSSFAGWR